MLEFLIFAFRAFRPEFRSYPEWTIAPREGSRRIPDLCLCASRSETPLLCVEIISPDDKASVLRKKIKEYLAWGVEYVWVSIPWNWMAMCTPMRASSACRMASFGRESWK